MNKKVAPSLIAVAIAALGATAAQADDWYGGVGAGWSQFRDLSKVDGNADENATAVSLFGGYNFTENFGAELGYLYGGRAEADDQSFRSQGATLTGIARLPINDIFSVFAEGGGYGYHVNGNGTSDNGLAPLAGLGVTAKLTDLIDLQARYRYIWDVGDEDKTFKSDLGAATLELVFHPYRTSYVAPTPAPAAPEPAPQAQVVDKEFSLSSDVLFAFGKSTLKPEGVSALNTLYQQISDARPTDGQAVVIGYTDFIGSDKANQRLSEARAKTVADYLVSKGLPASKVSIEGRGEASPVTGTTCVKVKPKAKQIACLAPDRRVQVHVTGTQQAQN
jgi:OOP family OmpA-OmpF porin